MPLRLPNRLLLASLLAATAAYAGPSQAADSANGERLARRWCASCHVVAPDQPMATTEAPSFSSIARKPGFNASFVALFLLDPHPKMPDMGLSRRAAEDLAAYIATMR